MRWTALTITTLPRSKQHVGVYIWGVSRPGGCRPEGSAHASCGSLLQFKTNYIGRRVKDHYVQAKSRAGGDEPTELMASRCLRILVEQP